MPRIYKDYQLDNLNNQKYILKAIALAFASLSSSADERLIFNKETKRSVLAMAKDQKLPVYLRYTYVSELCFKGDVRVANAGLLSLKEKGIVLSDSETDLYIDSVLTPSTINVKTFSSKVQDEGEYPYEKTVIRFCRF